MRLVLMLGHWFIYPHYRFQFISAKTNTSTWGECRCQSHNSCAPVSVMDGWAADKANSKACSCLFRKEGRGCLHCTHSALCQQYKLRMYTHRHAHRYALVNYTKLYVIVFLISLSCFSHTDDPLVPSLAAFRLWSLLTVYVIVVSPYLLVLSTSKLGSIKQAGYWSLGKDSGSVNSSYLTQPVVKTACMVESTSSWMNLLFRHRGPMLLVMWCMIYCRRM